MSRQLAFNTTPATISDGSDRYLTLRELASYSAMSLRTLRRALNDRIHPLPHYRPGGRKILVRRTEFDTWMQQFRQIPNQLDLNQLIEKTIQEICPGGSTLTTWLYGDKDGAPRPARSRR